MSVAFLMAFCWRDWRLSLYLASKAYPSMMRATCSIRSSEIGLRGHQLNRVVSNVDLQTHLPTPRTPRGLAALGRRRAFPLGHTMSVIEGNSEVVGGQLPVLTSSNPLSTLSQRFACARLPQLRLSRSCPDFSATFGDSSLRWLEISI
jgi:hypothetical protein